MVHAAERRILTAGVQFGQVGKPMTAEQRFDGGIVSTNEWSTAR